MKEPINSKNARYWTTPILLFSIITLGIFVCVNVDAQNTIVRGNKSERPKSRINEQASVSWPTGYVNCHRYVDLGLPNGTKWASCNVGVNRPDDFGSCLARGEISTKQEYTEDNYKIIGIDISDISDVRTYDAANYAWGNSWRMPTRKDWEELIKKCRHRWALHAGIRGYEFIGPNGNAIFLSASGYKANGLTNTYTWEIEKGGSYENNKCCSYWSATCCEEILFFDEAEYLRCDELEISLGCYYKFAGMPIRHVTK